MTVMRVILITHVTAGALALLAGYVALSVAKGASTHRRSGMAFVCAMIAMTACGMVLAAAGGGPWGAVNFRAAALTAYLVVTAMTTVRPPSAGSRWLDLAGLSVAAVLGVISLAFGVEAIANGGRRNVPALLALPVLTVLVAMLYWLWRVRIRRSLRGIVGAGTLESSPATSTS